MTNQQSHDLLYRLYSANILIDQNWRGKLTDLGVARSMELGLHTTSTQTIVGTRIYMAPEYCTGLVSPAADVYSLGVVINVGVVINTA